MPAHVISSNGNTRVVALSEHASYYDQSITVDQKLVAFTPYQIFLQVSATPWNGECEPARDFFLSSEEMADLIQAYQTYLSDRESSFDVCI